VERKNQGWVTTLRRRKKRRKQEAGKNVQQGLTKYTSHIGEGVSIKKVWGGAFLGHHFDRGGGNI